MAQITTIDDVLNEIADLLGCYGACKASKHESCDDKSPVCCRVGFMIEFRTKIDVAIENEKRLQAAGL